VAADLTGAPLHFLCVALAAPTLSGHALVQSVDYFRMRTEC